MSHADALRACCDTCRAALERAEAAGLGCLSAFVADPLNGVDLRDRGWAVKFDAAHPNRRAFFARGISP